ncbi:MAG: PhoH family protein, partial [Clostridia bacterium]|nr:PhoH family protein [Clostridia bacterium]
HVLKGVDDIEIIKFTQKDVVRHQLVQKIVKAYDKYEEQKRSKNHGKG